MLNRSIPNSVAHSKGRAHIDTSNAAIYNSMVNFYDPPVMKSIGAENITQGTERPDNTERRPESNARVSLTIEKQQDGSEVLTSRKVSEMDTTNAHILGLQVQIKSKNKNNPFLSNTPLSVIHSDGISVMSTNPNGTSNLQIHPKIVSPSEQKGGAELGSENAGESSKFFQNQRMLYLNNKFSPMHNTIGDTMYKAVKIKNPLILTEDVDDCDSFNLNPPTGERSSSKAQAKSRANSSMRANRRRAKTPMAGASHVRGRHATNSFLKNRRFTVAEYITTVPDSNGSS